jgi:hypothetical protein
MRRLHTADRKSSPWKTARCGTPHPTANRRSIFVVRGSPHTNNFAEHRHADVNGWLFLTGTPKQIDDVMARFKLFRQREADGTVDHVLEFFLVDANGHTLFQYMGEKVEPEQVATDCGAGGGG